MPIYKRCTRCGNRLPSGSRCDCYKQRHKEYDKHYRDKKFDKFYHSKEWELARQDVLILDKGLDVYTYMTTGDTVLADAVHHIEPLKDNWERRCDHSNLISLSSDNHSAIEKMYERDKENTMKMLNFMIQDFRRIFNEKNT